MFFVLFEIFLFHRKFTVDDFSARLKAQYQFKVKKENAGRLSAAYIFGFGHRFANSLDLFKVLNENF